MTGFPMLPYWEFDRWIEIGRVRRIIDLREPWLYEEERIRGSENIPMMSSGIIWGDKLWRNDRILV